MKFENSPIESEEKSNRVPVGEKIVEAQKKTLHFNLSNIQRKLSGVDDVQFGQYLISEDVENLLRYRVSRENIGPVMESLAADGLTEDLYRKEIENSSEALSQQPRIARFPMNGWLAVQLLDEEGGVSKHPGSSESGVFIIPKEYWTLDPSDEEEGARRLQVEKFIQQLPKIIEYLRDDLELSFFGVKIPDQLNRLLRNRDSVVIHYPDAAIRETMRGKIDMIFSEAGVKMEQNRSRRSGVDFQWKNSSRNVAYSTVIGRIIACKIAEVAVSEPEKIRFVEDLQVSIETCMQEIETWDGEKLLEQFTESDR